MKKFVKNFNNLIKETIFNVQNKTNNKFQISRFNKYLITLISLLFFYLFYLSIPILYDKTWVQQNIESQLLKEFQINLSTSSDVLYQILPTPHFLFKNSKIFKDGDEKIDLLSDIKDLKVFISQRNFFDKEKLFIKNVKINNANFSVLRSDFNLLNNASNKKFSSKKIEVNNSNIFFKDNLSETIAIIRIDKALLFFDKKKLLNLMNLKAEVFNIPFIFDMKNKINYLEKKEININAKTLKLNIFNTFNKDKNNFFYGSNIITFSNSRINTNYKAEDNLISFSSKDYEDSKINKSKIEYKGNFSINPFDLKLNINLSNYKVSKILNINSILVDLIKTELLFNENINMNASITVNSNIREEIFQNAKINFDIINGKIDLNKTKLISDQIGSLELDNSNLFYKNNKLTLNTDILISIKNTKALFSFLQTNKKYRKKFKNILINLDYDLLANQVKFNNVKIDNKEVNEELLIIMEGFNDINFNNFNKSRRLANKLIQVYEG
tara:strand:+ start:441 stop:1934 length:1494 start_codon:yes stop_codon:yes gene_type:complete